MAIVGDAYVVVRAITDGVEDDIARAFNGAGGVGGAAGDDAGEAFSRGFRRRSKSLFDLDALENARKQFNRLIRVGYALGPAISTAVGAIGALGTGVFLLGGALGSTLPTLIVFPSLLTAIAQAAVVLKLAFKGVGEAISAGLKPASGGQAQQAAKAIRDALQGVQKARESLGRTETRQAEQLEDALDELNDAELELVGLQEEAADAQERLNEAYKEGKEALEELAFEAEDAALKQEGAGLALERARENLARVQDLPPNSRARREAELAFKEAELNYRRAVDSNQEAQEENDNAQKAGVEGTKEVRDAQEDAAEARERVAKKQAEIARQEVMLQRMIRDQAWELKDAQDAVRDAEERLADARDSATKGTNEYADKLSKLPPAAQKFVKYIVSLKPLFDELRNIAAENFFPPFQKGLETLMKNGEEVFKRITAGTAKALGEAGGSFLEFMGSARMLSNIEFISETNNYVIEKFGKIMENLVGTFSELLVAADPLIRRFADWVETVTKGWHETAKLKRDTGELTETFNKAGDRLAVIGDIFGNVFGGLKAATSAASPAIDFLLKKMQESTANFEKFMKAPENQPMLQKFFMDSAKNFTSLSGLVGDILKAFLRLGADPNLGKTLEALRPLVPIFEAIGRETLKAGPSFAKFLESFGKFVQIMTSSGAIQMFFDVLRRAFDILNKIFGSEVGMKILAIVGIVKGFTLAVGLLGSGFKFVFQAIAGSVVMVFKKFGILKAAIGQIAQGKNPFSVLMSGSAMTRKELTKQMIVDRQKKAALQGIYLSGVDAAKGINLVKSSSAQVTPVVQKSIATDKAKSGALAAMGGAATKAAIGIKAVGRSMLTLVGGPIGAIFLLITVVPMIIKNWDKIVEFFKELPGKLMELGKKIWNWITESLPPIIDKVVAWFTDTLIPWLGELPGKMLQLYVKFWSWIFDLLLDLLPKIASWFTDTLWPFLKELPGKMLKLYANFWMWIFDLLGELFGKIGSWFADTLWPFLKELPGKMLSMYANFWMWIFDLLAGLFTKIGEWFSNTLWPFLAGLPGKMLSMYAKFWMWIFDLLVGVGEKIWSWFSGTLLPFITGLPGKLLNAGGKVWNFLTDLLSAGWEKAKKFFTDTIIPWITGLPGRFLSGAKNIWGFLTDGLKNAVNMVINLLNKMIEAINKISFKVPNIPGVPGRGTTVGFNLPRIPNLAEGGVINPTPGGTLARIGEAGRPERVEPLDEDGLSKRDKAIISMLAGGNTKGNTFNVYPSEGMDERELAEMVSRQVAFQMRRGGA